ncbi:MAG: cell division protein SepF [Acidimicrobiales bacterium]|nr:cell division protein SepF [Acidimicrobiales bacterium]
MANTWRKAMTYLGLGPDDEYDDRDVRDDAAPAREGGPAGPPPARSAAPSRSRPPAPKGVPAPPAAAFPGPAVEPTEPPAVRTLPTPGDDAPKPRVRAVPRTPQVKAHLVAPVSFNQAQEVADRFKASQPVVLDLSGVDRDLSRRLIDFSSGLCYGLAGQMGKVANHVYLLTPAGVEISAEERRRLGDASLTGA